MRGLEENQNEEEEEFDAFNTETFAGGLGIHTFVFISNYTTFLIKNYYRGGKRLGRRA